MYLIIKHLHMTTVAISLTLFILRAGMHWLNPQQQLPKWLRILPHINDTILLASAAGLAILIQQYPFVDAWLTTKLLLLLVYIMLGMWTLKKATTRTSIAVSASASLLCFAYIVAVAVQHSPLPFQG